MSDDQAGGPLVVSGGGAFAVATESVLLEHHRLLTLADRLDTLLPPLVSFERQGVVAHASVPLLLWLSESWLPAPWLPQHSMLASELAAALAELIGAVRSARDAARLDAAALRSAATLYADAEAAASGVGKQLLSFGLDATTPVAEGLGLLALFGGGQLAVGAYLFSKLDPGDAEAARGRALQFLLEHQELITSPAFVALVRAVARDLDNVTLSAVGVPPGLATVLGDEHVGVVGLEQSAVGLMAIGGLFGLFQEGQVRADRTSRRTVRATEAPPAAGVTARLERLPKDGGVRVERWQVPGGEPRYVVYIGPTDTFSPEYTHSAGDLTSNIGGVARIRVGQFRAIEEAMADAGVTRTDQVQFVGFSQGGLMATMLAGSKDWNCVGLETAAAPAGNVPLPDTLPGMAIRHSDDFVPALAGDQLPTKRLQVEQQAFANHAPPAGVAVPAHQLDSYLATAERIDASRLPEIREQVAKMDAFTAQLAAQPGAEVTVSEYTTERVGPGHPILFDALTPGFSAAPGGAFQAGAGSSGR